MEKKEKSKIGEKVRNKEFENEAEKEKEKEEREATEYRIGHSTDLDPVCARRNVPICDYTKEELVLNLEINPASIELILSNIRDKFIKNTEITAFSFVESNVEMSTIQKSEFTEILEEQLRNHW